MSRRKLTVLALITVIILILAACGGSDPEPTATPEPPAAAEEEAAAEEAAEEEAAEGDAAEGDAAEEEAAEGDAAEGDAAEGDAAEGDAAEGDAAEGDAAEGDAAEGDAAEGDAAEGDAAEGDAAEGDAAEGDAAEGDAAEGDAAEGDAAEGDAAEGDAAEGDAAEGDAAEGDAAEGDAAEGDAAEGDAAEGDAAEGDAAEGDAAEGDAAEGDAAEGDAAEGDAAEGDAAEGEAAEGDAAEGEAAEGEAAEGEAAEGDAAEGDAAEGEAAEGDAAEGDAAEGDAAEGDAAEEEVAEEVPPSSGVVTVESERLVREIIGEDQPMLATVSPDGAQIAWAGTEGRGNDRVLVLCLFTFSNADKSCTNAPSTFSGFPYRLAWSPDATRIAFTENPIQLGDESDIWIFDVASGAFVNRTDDGVQGSYLAAEAGTYELDYVPMWNAADGQIYFWRAVPAGNLQFSFDLYRLDPEAGGVEMVLAMTEALPGHLVLFNNEQFYMDGPSAIAPDGSKLAVVLSSLSSGYGTAESGLWIIDLANPENEPQQLMDHAAIQTALPDWQNMPASPFGLSWTSNSNAVVLLAISNDTHSPLRIFYYNDVESGEVTPLVDFSGVPDLESLFAPEPETGLPYRYFSPWTASMSPYGDKLIMYNDLSNVFGLLQVNLPPDGSLPAPLYQSELMNSLPVADSSRASDGKMLIYSVMFTLLEE